MPPRGDWNWTSDCKCGHFYASTNEVTHCESCGEKIKYTKTVPPALLEYIYSLCKRGFNQHAEWATLDYLEKQLSDGCFSTVDEFFVKAEVERLNPSVLVIALSITFHGKQHLTQREQFLDKAEHKIIEALGKDRALELLKNRR